MSEWSVHAEADIGDVPVDDIADALAERLQPHSADIAETAGGRLSVQLHTEASTLRKAFDAGVRDLTEALHAQGLPTRVTRVTVMGWEELEAELASPRLPPLMGIAEIAAVLGVTKQRVRQLIAENPQFFPEVARVAAGPLYTEAAVKAFAGRERKRGRPRKNPASA